jgi:hypothetical protein
MMTRICMFEGFDSIRQEKEKVIQKNEVLKLRNRS